MAVMFYRSKKTGDYHWQVRATSRGRRILADSGEGYKRPVDCRAGFVLATREMVRYALGLKGKV